jgi:hypothetical protein
MSKECAKDSKLITLCFYDKKEFYQTIQAVICVSYRHNSFNKEHSAVEKLRSLFTFLKVLTIFTRRHPE